VTSFAAIALLVVGIAAMFLRPFGLPLWVGPVIAAAVGLATQVIEWDDASDALHLLTKPLLFLVFAVPLAVVLDRMGVLCVGRPTRRTPRSDRRLSRCGAGLMPTSDNGRIVEA